VPPILLSTYLRRQKTNNSILICSISFVRRNLRAKQRKTLKHFIPKWRKEKKKIDSLIIQGENMENRFFVRKSQEGIFPKINRTRTTNISPFVLFSRCNSLVAKILYPLPCVLFLAFTVQKSYLRIVAIKVKQNNALEVLQQKILFCRFSFRLRQH